MNLLPPICVGYINKPHGLKGEFTALITVDQQELEKEISTILIEINKELISFSIQAIRPHKEKFIIKLEKIDSIEQVEELIGCALYLTSDLFSEPTIGLLTSKVIGYIVIDEVTGEIGSVTNLIQKPHQDLLIVACKGKEILIPIHEDIILVVDQEAKKIITHLPEGLIDLYLLE